MSFITYLVATLATCQAARIPRDIGPSHNFHAVHHGHGATSYQNVQMESYGTVSAPTADHHYHHQPYQHYHEHPFIIHVPEDSHQDDYTAIPPIESIPLEHHQDLQHIIFIKKDSHDISLLTDGHNDAPVINNDVYQLEVHDVPHLHYIGEHFQHNHEYEYH